MAGCRSVHKLAGRLRAVRGGGRLFDGDTIERSQDHSRGGRLSAVCWREDRGRHRRRRRNGGAGLRDRRICAFRIRKGKNCIKTHNG